jgi:peptide/nickel transport system substrate-binding protein
MGSPSRRSGLLSALLLLIAACSSDSADLTTTEGSQTIVVAPTTTIPVTTTTTEPDPCNAPFCVVYNIHPDASWSDGVPVTAEDFSFTLDAYMDPVGGPADKIGHDLITSMTVLDDKTLLFAFDEVYAPWRDLFPVVLPSHVLEGIDPADAWALASGTTAGPYVLEEWVNGESVLLRRNPQYWASEDPVSGISLGDVTEIRLVFSDSVRDSIQGLGRGEVDLIAPRPLDWMVTEVSALEAVDFDIQPGPFWEHIDFNHDDPLLSQSWVREAVTLAIDRNEMLASTVGTVDPSAQTLDNTVWMSQSGFYEPHYRDAYDPEAAEQLLVDHFCEKGGDGIYSCQGRRLSFNWATTVGDDYRATQFEIAQDSLAAVGIEVVGDFVTPSQLFSAPVFFGGPEVWQIINFSWKASADPHLGNTTYQCTGSAPSGFGALNVNRYCDPDLDALIESTDHILDPVERATAYNEADASYLGGLSMIPLYQKPTFLAWSGQLTGPEINISRSTYLWNVASWTGKDSVIVVLEAEPDPGHPLSIPSEDLAVLSAPLLQGAFGLTPGLEYVPVLVESVDLIVGEG